MSRTTAKRIAAIKKKMSVGATGSKKVNPESPGSVSNDEENKFTQQAKCGYCMTTFKSIVGVKIHEKKCKLKPTENGEARISVVKTTQLQTNGIKSSVVNREPCTNGMDQSSSQEVQNGVEMMLNDKEYERNTPSQPFDQMIVKLDDSLCTCCGENLETAHISGDFECYECKKFFLLKSSLERHIKTIHQGDSHKCPQCGARCPDKGTLARHMYTHTGLKPYSCPVCKQEFSRKYHLVRHNMQTGCDGKEKPIFPCQVCGREFNRKDNLREHLRAHAGQTKRKKLFSCDFCGMEFCGTNLLQIHKKTHTGEKHYVCDFCPKRFPTSGAMKKHRRTHTGERPYECDTCHKRFAAKETLNRHVRIHTGYKPHCCNYCGKRFIQSSQLRSHLFYHTGQNVLQQNEAFVCELCGKKFNRRARLNEHVKYVHLGAKPFECDHCSKTFIRKEDLNRHLIIHSGIKAHQCPICSKSFAMKSSLKVHLLTHTKEPPRSCDECGRAFIRQDCLLRHMRNKHRDMLEEIRSEAEKKKLQQQLLQVAAEASIVEGLEDRAELDEKGLTDAVRELLTLLVDEATLRGLGWPEAGVEALLEAVIRRCGHEPASLSIPHHERLRHNIKLLFTVVIDDSAVKALLNNQSVDEVILHVLRLAKS
ncbi:zinc finger protein 2 isoform X2 [Cimex lectularius]|uniref:C2H2-type domain-containing protein n=1 Tax=Cimex lectularius TaxID=79782 RepID=A0A8I6RNP1_CIMLE|nr:zinc finger protein 2 isoform X2 [Cimex lectularius]